MAESRQVRVRAEIPKTAEISDAELQRITEETENEIVDELRGERAAVFLKIKGVEKTEIAKSVDVVKEKVF